MEKGFKAKVVFVFGVILSCMLSANAQEYTIIKMSAPQRIKIGGVWKYKDSKFDGKSNIEWYSNQQWFKATRADKLYKVTCRGFKEIQGKSLNAFIERYLGHKGVDDLHYSKKEFYLLGDVDTLLFETMGRTEPDMKIIASWSSDNHTIEIPIKKTKDNLHYCISTDIYKGVRPIPEHVKLSIREEKENWIDNVYTDINIYYLPEK